jgi:transcriptional regulator with XRE-family HTH domain
MKIEITKSTSAVAKLFAQPPSIEGEADYQKLLFVEELLGLMKEQGMSRAELARRMDARPSRITSMLTGTNNFTIETMVRAARAVNAKFHHCLAPASKSVRWQSWEKGDAPAISFVPPKKKEPALKVAKAAEEPASYGKKRRTAKNLK